MQLKMLNCCWVLNSSSVHCGKTEERWVTKIWLSCWCVHSLCLSQVENFDERKRCHSAEIQKGVPTWEDPARCLPWSLRGQHSFHWCISPDGPKATVWLIKVWPAFCVLWKLICPCTMNIPPLTGRLMQVKFRRWCVKLKCSFTYI